MARVVHPLFVAMTRPAVWFGVPWDGFVANIGVTFFVTVAIVHSPPGFLLGIGVHFALRELCAIDPHFFGKWKLFFNTKMKSTTGIVWGGSRLQPSPLRIKNSSEMRTSV
jgi:type IV secretion system protein VirB3